MLPVPHPVPGADGRDAEDPHGAPPGGPASDLPGYARLFHLFVHLFILGACRGWFQSSLLTSIATNGIAPYKTVLTHGFVLDEKGNKMSKSLGNTVDPLLVINGGKNLKQEPAYGADVLRLWVSSIDYSNDVSIGPNIIKQVRDLSLGG